LVFEGDVLPDGTEVAYYAHGQVALIDIDSVIFFPIIFGFYLSLLYFCFVVRNCWLVTKKDMQFFVPAATLRCFSLLRVILGHIFSYDRCLTTVLFCKKIDWAGQCFSV